MIVFNAVYQAIMVRQTERLNRGEIEMTEMWLPPETYDRLIEEAKSICTVRDPSIKTTKLCGVELKRICLDQ